MYELLKQIGEIDTMITTPLDIRIDIVYLQDEWDQYLDHVQWNSGTCCGCNEQMHHCDCPF